MSYGCVSSTGAVRLSGQSIQRIHIPKGRLPKRKERTINQFENITDAVITRGKGVTWYIFRHRCADYFWGFNISNFFIFVSSITIFFGAGVQIIKFFWVVKISKYQIIFKNCRQIFNSSKFSKHYFWGLQILKIIVFSLRVKAAYPCSRIQ